MTRRLRPSYRHPDARAYRALGGPWDASSLDVLLAAATARARGPLIYDDTSEVALDGAALEDLVAAIAGGLRAEGVRRGDVVAWQAPNWHEVVLLYRACWRLGAVAAPLHHQAGAADIDRMLSVLAPQVWLPADELRRRVSALASGGTPVQTSAARPSDLAVALFTSGATGDPKAVLHTQRGLAYKARTMRVVHGLTPTDAVLMPAPMAHISGLLNGVLVPGAVPMRTRLMAKWDPQRGLDLIERDRTTFMIGPTTLFVSIIDAPGFSGARVESLRLVSSGTAGVSPAFIDDAGAQLGAQVKRSYGSTEAPTVTTTHAGDPPERGRDTDGRPTGVARLQITDPATGRERAPGEVGEVWLRGPELFAGYADVEQTRAAVTRGWFRTGDLATVDAGCWLTIVGRIKDIIIRAGENIAATDVETVLEAHPAVRHAIAVGMPDDRLGERVCAFIVASEPFDLEECRRWFQQSGVARYKTPERVVQVDELPLLAAGKADRAALRARAAALASE
jgi:acyl-CoA synthetase (AMP-forming)/AMP-acid ligase II